MAESRHPVFDVLIDGSDGAEHLVEVAADDAASAIAIAAENVGATPAAAHLVESAGFDTHRTGVVVARTLTPDEIA